MTFLFLLLARILVDVSLKNNFSIERNFFTFVRELLAALKGENVGVIKSNKNLRDLL